MQLTRLIFIGIVVAGLMAFALAFSVRLRKGQSVAVPGWRWVIFSLGFLAVAAQFLLFALSWTRIGADYALFARWARFVYRSFVIAIVSILAGKGAARWWLLASSTVLFVICLFIMLSP
jgi:hypothetical protein